LCLGGDLQLQFRNEDTAGVTLDHLRAAEGGRWKRRGKQEGIMSKNGVKRAGAGGRDARKRRL
jgi:hypothetical protein